MNDNQRKILNLGFTLTSSWLFVGFVVACFGFLESGLVMEKLLSIGIGIMAASSILFGFGLVLALLEEGTGRTSDPN